MLASPSNFVHDCFLTSINMTIDFQKVLSSDQYSSSSCELNVRSRDNDFTKSKNLSEYIVFKSELPVATNLLIFFFDSKDPKTSFRIDKLELVGLLCEWDFCVILIEFHVSFDLI